MRLLKKDVSARQMLESATLLRRQALAMQEAGEAREAEDAARRRWVSCSDELGELERMRLAGVFLSAQEYTERQIMRANDYLRIREA